MFIKTVQYMLASCDQEVAKKKGRTLKSEGKRSSFYLTSSRHGGAMYALMLDVSLLEQPAGGWGGGGVAHG